MAIPVIGTADVLIAVITTRRGVETVVDRSWFFLSGPWTQSHSALRAQRGGWCGVRVLHLCRRQSE